MRVARLFAALLLPALVFACGPAMRPVTFDAKPADWETLSGDWRGEYSMSGHDRHGLIAFTLRAGPQRADGDVLMIPDTFGWPYRGVPGGDPADARRSDLRSQLLAIRFVRAEGGRISGTMDPYWDPDRSCRAFASFIGSVDGDVIAGTFISVCEDGVRTLRGRWKVQRTRHAEAPGDRRRSGGPDDPPSGFSAVRSQPSR